MQVLSSGPRDGNLVARLRGSGASGQKPILLLAHLDVVAARREDWSIDPFAFTEKDGFYYGRGTSDDKAMAAIWIANFIRMKQDAFDTFLLLPTLTSPKPRSGYPLELKTVADHLRKRRLDLGLTRAAVAARIGVGAWSYGQWERGLSNELRYFPAIVEFLGYNPLLNRGRSARRCGESALDVVLTRRQLAQMAAVTEGAVDRVEGDTPRTLRRTRH